MTSSDADGRARLDERLRVALEAAERESAPVRMLPSGELVRTPLSAGRGPLGRALLLVKRVLRRSLREVLARQSAFNAGIEDQLLDLSAQVAAAEQHAEVHAHVLGDLERRIAALESGSAAAREQSADWAQELAQLGAQVRRARSRRDGESGDSVDPL